MAAIVQLVRALLIIRRIRDSRSPYPTLADIMNYVERQLLNRDINKTFSERTYYKDFNDIKRLFKLDIKHTTTKEGKGYLISEELHPDLIDIEEVLGQFEIFNALRLDNSLTDYIVTEKHGHPNNRYVVELVSAIKKNLQIKLEYKKFENSEVSVRELEPYFVKQFKGRWYVVGKESNINNFKTFGLDRISQLSYTNKIFKRDKQFDIQAKFENSFGIYSSEEYPVEDIELAFDTLDGSYITAAPIHHSQKIVKNEDGEFVITLRLRITHDFVMELLSRSNSLKVIKPVSLKKTVAKIYKAALERNS